MEDIIKELESIGKKLFQDFETDSYEIRCKLYDIREKLKTL